MQPLSLGHAFSFTLCTEKWNNSATRGLLTAIEARVCSQTHTATLSPNALPSLAAVVVEQNKQCKLSPVMYVLGNTISHLNLSNISTYTIRQKGLNFSISAHNSIQNGTWYSYIMGQRLKLAICNPKNPTTLKGFTLLFCNHRKQNCNQPNSMIGLLAKIKERICLISDAAVIEKGGLFLVLAEEWTMVSLNWKNQNAEGENQT